jgi:small subunit ribosomal protein S1
MEYQKFIPEGWYKTKENLSIEDIEKAKNTGRVIQGLAYKCDDEFNIHVKLGDKIEGIIPKNEVEFKDKNSDVIKSGIYKNKVNNFIQFKVKRICDDSTVILSRKNVYNDAFSWVKNDLHPGDIVNGIVKNIRPYGVFVEIGGGVVGLIHIQDISISRMKNPKERFFIGQKIKTMIKSIDEENSKVVLSYKELLRKLG